MITAIELISDEARIRETFPIVKQLRPALGEDELVERVMRQLGDGYRFCRLVADGKVCAVAGYRFAESLGHGKFMYVDDLVADEGVRSQGYGGMLFDWLADQARREGCAEFRLDCGVQRFDSHRFYARKRMKIAAHHFLMKL